MVGADPVDVAATERGPQRLLVGLAADRRTAEEAVAVGAREMALLEEQVLRAGLKRLGLSAPCAGVERRAKSLLT